MNEEQKNDPSTPPAAPGSPASFQPDHAKGIERSSLEKLVVEAMKTIFDPEIPVNIYELGLIYDFNVSPTGATDVRMTLTSPACPVAGSLPGDVENVIRKVDGISEVKVEVIWEPPWTPELMTEAARLQLGMF